MKNLDVLEIPLNEKVIIEASAGTGKTYTIGLIVLRLLLEKLLPIEEIVLITFTKAATAELKKNTTEKVLKAYKIWKKPEEDESEKILAEIVKKAKKENAQKAEANLLDAIVRIDEMPIYTIHGFCERILNEFSFEIENFEERDVVIDQSGIIGKIIADFWRKEIKDLNESIKLNPYDLISAVTGFLNNYLAETEGEDYEQALEGYRLSDENNVKHTESKLKYAIVYKLLKEARVKLHEEKRKLKVMDYNDMIENCHNGILNDSKKTLKNAIKKRYKAILVDEFQDTDRAQYEIFDYLFSDMPFFMIGDPKQAIYKFRGGDIFTYKQARESTGNNQFFMNENYRSEKTLLEALNTFFLHDSFKEKMGEGIYYKKVECGKTELEPVKERDNQYRSFVILKGRKNENKADFESKTQEVVVEEIKRLLTSGKFQPKEIAILLETNYDCSDYKNALAKHGIFAIVKGDSIFISDSAIFLKILLNAICNSNDIKYIRTLLLNSFCGFEPKDIDNVLFLEWANVINNTKEEWQKRGVMRAIDYFMENRNLWGSIAENENGERNISNIRQIMELLNNEEVKYGKIPEKIKNRFSILCLEAKNSEETEERLETDDEALKIMTIHKSKGLQFDIVFVPDVSKEPHSHEFPNPYKFHKDNKKLTAYFSKNDEMKYLNDCEEKEEIARLLYVSLTRVKYRLYVAFSPPKRNKNGSISLKKGSTSVGREIFENFCESNIENQNIQIEDLDEVHKRKYTFTEKNKENEIKKEYLRPPKIESTWEKTSFSAISQELQHKEYIREYKNIKIKDIPAGKRMGTLLHGIFENLDFYKDETEIQSVIKNKLAGLKTFSDETEEGIKNISRVEEMVKIIIKKKLPGSGAGRLYDIDADINVNKKITELNFFMGCNNINLNNIKTIMTDKINEFEAEILYAKYVNGFIDLIFLGNDNKYYILDWKSNSLDGFAEEKIAKEMKYHGYHLQYYIYAVALKRWLERTHKNMDFNERFGGVYYVFIRGVNEENDEGFFFADGKDIIDSIEKMDKIFNGVTI